MGESKGMEGFLAWNKQRHNSLQEGVTLRDYFAAKALQGLIPIYWDSVDEYSDASELVKCLSTAAYEHADAMLKARGEQS